MTVDQGHRCDQCRHMRQFGDPMMLCFVGPFSRPVRYQRDYRSICGPEGRLWEPRVTQEAHDAARG